MELLMREFPQEDFKTSTIGSKNADEDTDNSICPFIDLPDDWDAYLATRLSSNSRQKLRRLLRTLERSATLRITHASSATIERDIKILLHFWKRTWQERKGDRLASILRLNSAMLLRNFADGNVFIPVLWDDRRPLGVLAFFVDQRKKSLLFSIAGRDTDYQDISPGLLLHAYSIRLAISKGCRIYDFLRGNEPYKYSFGARDHRLHSFAIARR
jgi:CelD/BcsL family acetyltransferase involved in cellulose biosynthesis